MDKPNMPVCPKCGSSKVETERRPHGDHICKSCRHKWPNKRPTESADHALARLRACVADIRNLRPVVVPKAWRRLAVEIGNGRG